MSNFIHHIDIDIGFDRSDDGYKSLLQCIERSFAEAVKQDGSEPLFRTDAQDLFELFLDCLPAEARQEYNCNTCRSFVNHYGGLVHIDNHGNNHPVMWKYIPEGIFTRPVQVIRDKVRDAHVIGVFLTDKEELGKAMAGGFHHMAVETHKNMIRRNLLKTPAQQEAEKSLDYQMLTSAIQQYQTDTVETAVHLLRTDTLYRSEKVLGVAEWFLNVKQTLPGNHKRRRNLIWKAAATPITAFCHRGMRQPEILQYRS